MASAVPTGEDIPRLAEVGHDQADLALVWAWGA